MISTTLRCEEELGGCSGLWWSWEMSCAERHPQTSHPARLYGYRSWSAAWLATPRFLCQEKRLTKNFQAEDCHGWTASNQSLTRCSAEWDIKVIEGEDGLLTSTYLSGKRVEGWEGKVGVDGGEKRRAHGYVDTVFNGFENEHWPNNDQVIGMSCGR